MKKLIAFCVLFFAVSQWSHAQKKVYISDKFETLSKNHKVIAILPFETTLNLKTKKEYSKKQIKQLEKKEGFAVQSALESYFLNRKKKKKLSIDFQDINTTNTLLKKNNITYDNLDIYTSKELCEILKVDAVVSGSLISRLLISEKVDTSFDLITYLKGKSDYGKIIIKLSDSKTGKLLWRYEKTMNRKSGKNTKAIIASMMRKASRKFPYEKKR